MSEWKIYPKGHNFAGPRPVVAAWQMIKGEDLYEFTVGIGAHGASCRVVKCGDYDQPWRLENGAAVDFAIDAGVPVEDIPTIATVEQVSMDLRILEAYRVDSNKLYRVKDEARSPQDESRYKAECDRVNRLIDETLSRICRVLGIESV